MHVIPLAADSLGVRSVATYVECGGTRILIDPGASLGESRFGLGPTEAEWEALRRANDRISAYAERATVVFLSHYHEDHFRYDPGLYAGRTVWAKDPTRSIAGKQSQRAARLWKEIGPQCRLDSAEGRCVETPDVILSASPPLPHGPDGTALGQVVALTVTDRREGFRFVHASDVQGPVSAVATAYLIRERPNLLYLSGPPSYLENQIGSRPIERGIENLLAIIERTGCRVILDHYLVRDPDYRERFQRLWDTGRVVTAAEFLGLETAPLEALRRVTRTSPRKPPAVMPRRSADRLNGGRAGDIMGRRSAYRQAKGGKTR
ncbi:MAG TPA: hypothetical protein VFN71_15905 [Methylomirabilota bacterium]|nr:hypothetical protein [Methylomirabilota bacterium]